MYFIWLWFKCFFKVYYFQSFKKKYFVKKIKDLACSFFNAHALIDKGFIVLRLSVGLSKFLTKINSKLLSLEDLFLILSVWVPFIDTHLLITRSRSPDKVKVNYQGQIPENWLYLVFWKLDVKSIYDFKPIKDTMVICRALSLQKSLLTFSGKFNICSRFLYRCICMQLDLL